MGNLWRLLRGVLGNAIVWAAGWFMALVAMGTVLRVFGMISGHWGDMFRTAAMFGTLGAISSTAFSIFISLRYQGRRLSEIHWLRFGIGGGIVTAIFVPLFMFTMRSLAGDGPLPLTQYLSSALLAGGVGGIVALASLKVAQLGDRLLPPKRRDQIE